MSKTLITGCAGFIGSTLLDRLLDLNYKVIGLDNFSTGREQFINNAKKNNNFEFHNIDLLKNDIDEYFKDVKEVFHFAANADVRNGVNNPTKDLEQNTIVTSRVLEASRKAGVEKFFFSSTGSIYGESERIPTPENTNFPIQTSLYGASKLACEGLITSYSYAYGIKSWIFRFVSILGERYTHGHVYDFYYSLKNNPKLLHVLGDGNQKKSYLYVQDCIDAIFHASKYLNNEINIVNLGVDDTCKVIDSVSWISQKLNLNPEIKFSGGKRGWVGDNPLIHLDTSFINNSGWMPKTSIKEGIIKTLNYLESNKWLFDK